MTETINAFRTPVRWWNSLKHSLFAPTNPNFLPDTKAVTRLGLFCLFLHPVFFLIDVHIGQPYESVYLRAFMFLLALPFVFFHRVRAVLGPRAELVFHLLLLSQLSVFTFFMYFQNQTTFWLVVLTNCIIIILLTVEMRAAAIYLILGAAIGLLGHTIIANTPDYQYGSEHFFAMVFTMAIGIWMAIRNGSARANRLNHAQLSLGVLAHELRTPLTTVQVLVGALEESEDEQAREIAILIEKAIANASALLDQQITNSSMLSSETSVELFSVGDACKSALSEFLGTLASSQSVAFRVDVPQDFVTRGPEQHFRRVIINLVKNANRAVLAKDGERAVTITVDCAGRVGRIKVTDTGIGIKPSQLALIWKAFHSTTPGFSHGLGLYYVKTVIERKMSGRIEVSSTPGQGATFTIELKVESGNSAKH